MASSHATARAKARIKQFLRQRARALAIETGRSLLRQRLEVRGIAVEELDKLVEGKLEDLGVTP